MKARYTSYECSPIHHDEAGSLARCEPDEAEFWGVYGRNPDGTAQHIGDALDSDSAESIVALLNWLIKPETGGI